MEFPCLSHTVDTTALLQQVLKTTEEHSTSSSIFLSQEVDKFSVVYLSITIDTCIKNKLTKQFDSLTVVKV